MPTTGVFGGVLDESEAAAGMAGMAGREGREGVKAALSPGADSTIVSFLVIFDTTRVELFRKRASLRFDA